MQKLCVIELIFELFPHPQYFLIVRHFAILRLQEHTNWKETAGAEKYFEATDIISLDDNYVE